MYNLRMLVICPKCQAENEDIARFCNQCGAVLDNSLPENKPQVLASADSAAPQEAAAGINWSALIIIVVVIAAIWYVVGYKGNDPKMAAGGGPAMPQEVLDSIAAGKATLKDDPANIEALRSLYETYGMVGKTAEVTPYAEAALEHLTVNAEALPADEQGDRLLALFIACYENRDDEICLSVLKEYHRQFPDNMRILKVLGDLSYDATLFDEAAKYYAEFLEGSDPNDDQETYLNAMTDMGSCFIQQGIASEENRTELLEEALSTFKLVLEINPDFWQAHFNVGVALDKLTRQEEAIAKWEWCIANSADEMQKYRASYAIAESKGEEPPEMPQSPHMEGFGGMANPHGEGAANPHGEGMAPPLDGDNLPPNPHGEGFMEQVPGNPEGNSSSDG